MGGGEPLKMVVAPETVDLPLGQQALIGVSRQQALIDRGRLLVSCPIGMRMGEGIGAADAEEIV